MNNEIKTHTPDRIQEFTRIAHDNTNFESLALVGIDLCPNKPEIFNRKRDFSKVNNGLKKLHRYFDSVKLENATTIAIHSRI